MKLGKTCRFCEIFDFGKFFYTKNIVILLFSNVFEGLFGCIRVPNGGLGPQALCLGYGWLNPGIIQTWINATTCCAARRSMVAVPVSLAPAHMHIHMHMYMHMYMYLLWIEVQKSIFEGCFETKIIFKNILGDLDLNPAQF